MSEANIPKQAFGEGNVRDVYSQRLVGDQCSQVGRVSTNMMEPTLAGAMAALRKAGKRLEKSSGCIV